MQPRRSRGAVTVSMVLTHTSVLMLMPVKGEAYTPVQETAILCTEGMSAQKVHAWCKGKGPFRWYASQHSMCGPF
jgi:hypothetical protein